jgi:hypothetical protein
MPVFKLNHFPYLVAFPSELFLSPFPWQFFGCSVVLSINWPMYTVSVLGIDSPSLPLFIFSFSVVLLMLYSSFNPCWEVEDIIVPDMSYFAIMVLL